MEGNWRNWARSCRPELTVASVYALDEVMAAEDWVRERGPGEEIEIAVGSKQDCRGAVELRL